MNLIHWLRSPIATLIVLCAALLAQLPHAADVFRLLVGGEGAWAIAHGYAYAIALELAVLLFVVQRRDAESYAFAGVSIMVNLSYYALHGTQLFSVAALPAWLVSIALPAAIARYSHLLVDAPDVAPAPAAAQPAPVAQPAPAPTAAMRTETQAQPATARGEDVGAPVAPDAGRLTKEQRRAQIESAGMTDAAQVVAAFGVGLRTAQSDIAAVRAAVTQTNGTAHA